MATKKNRKKPVMGRMPSELFQKLVTGTGIGAHKQRRNELLRSAKHKKDLRTSD
jgi:hypothetical protein